MELREVFDRQNKRVYRLACLYLKNVQDAEDAVQNIFMKYMSTGKAFDTEEYETAWFISVTKNYCKDVLRSSWKRRVEFGEVPEQAPEEEEGYDLLRHIYALPSKYREVLYLYYYEEYSVKEISGILNRKESTIQTQLFTARKKLKTVLEREGITYA